MSARARLRSLFPALLGLVPAGVPGAEIEGWAASGGSRQTGKGA